MRKFLIITEAWTAELESESRNPTRLDVVYEFAGPRPVVGQACTVHITYPLPLCDDRSVEIRIRAISAPVSAAKTSIATPPASLADRTENGLYPVYRGDQKGADRDRFDGVSVAASRAGRMAALESSRKGSAMTIDTVMGTMEAQS